MTEAEVGLAAADLGQPMWPDGQMVDRSQFVENLTEVGDVVVWPPSAVDEGIDGMTPVSSGSDGVETVADWFYGTGDPIDCWAGAPPVSARIGQVLFGGSEQLVFEQLMEMASEGDAATFASAHADGVGLTIEESESYSFVFSSGDQQERGLHSNAPCGGLHPGEMTACGSVPQCAFFDEGEDGRVRMIAQRGRWVVLLLTANAADPEALMTQAMLKIPT